MSNLLNSEKALIFRITHVDNVPWILANGLHCSNSHQFDPNYVPIGNAEIITRRATRIVPIAPGPTHDEATGFAEQIARAVAKVLPKIATVERMKEKRGGKLYVDYGQNGEGRTVVAPYTIRARDGAVVSTPIEWDELDEELDPRRFTIRTVLERVKERGDLYAGVLHVKQKLPRV